MTETLFVTGVVIANGIEDTDGDVLTKKDIKTIFTKYVNRDTDTMHKNIKNNGVDVIGNWITESDTILNGQNVPEGSWLATFKITNPTLNSCIRNGNLKGLSLGSVSEEAMTPKYWFINKSMNYRDLSSIEEVIPQFISFVDAPANKYTFEWMEYDAYINKNNKNGEKMTEEIEMVTAPVSFFDKLFEKFAINKSEEESVEKAEEEPTAEEETGTEAEDKVTALFEKLDLIIEQNKQILEMQQAKEETVDEEEEIEKAEDEETSTEEKKEEEDEEEVEDEKIEKSETEEEENDAEVEDEVEIEKRQTNMVENQIINETNTFYQKTGRDHLGRKIRK